MRTVDCRDCGVEQRAGSPRCRRCGASSPGFREHEVSRASGRQLALDVYGCFQTFRAVIATSYDADDLVDEPPEKILSELVAGLDAVAPLGFYFGAGESGAYGWWLERRRCRSCGRPRGRHAKLCANPRSQRRDGG